jgi:hypothetical protein
LRGELGRQCSRERPAGREPVVLIIAPSFRVIGDAVNESLEPSLGRDDEQHVHDAFAAGESFGVPVAGQLVSQTSVRLCAAVPLEITLDRTDCGLEEEAAVGNGSFVKR